MADLSMPACRAVRLMHPQCICHPPSMPPPCIPHPPVMPLQLVQGLVRHQGPDPPAEALLLILLQAAARAARMAQAWATCGQGAASLPRPSLMGRAAGQLPATQPHTWWQLLLAGEQGVSLHLPLTRTVALLLWGVLRLVVTHPRLHSLSPLVSAALGAGEHGRPSAAAVQAAAWQLLQAVGSGELPGVSGGAAGSAAWAAAALQQLIPSAADADGATRPGGGSVSSIDWGVVGRHVLLVQAWQCQVLQRLWVRNGGDVLKVGGSRAGGVCACVLLAIPQHCDLGTQIAAPI